MGLVLEEFYRSLECVGVSGIFLIFFVFKKYRQNQSFSNVYIFFQNPKFKAHTGEGFGDLFDAIARARTTYTNGKNGLI